MEGMPDKEIILLEYDNMKIIDNYRDLPIGMYLEICDIDRRIDIDDLHKQVCIISILSGMAEEDIYNLPIEDYKELAAKAHFLSKEYDGEVLTAKTYILDGWVLTPVADFRKITTAQYIDFQTFAAEGEKRIVEILSTMLVPKGTKYNQDYDVIELQEALRKHLSVADALSLFAFFLVRYHALIKDFLTSSKEMVLKMKDKEKRESLLKEIQRTEDLLKGGVGLPM